ncbi:MAG: right-handed parallel beta-helix repeat-containing protein [Haloarculaceae archaeon]
MDSSSPGRGSVATLATVLLLLAVGILGATGVAGAQASTIYVDGGADDSDCGGASEYGSIQNAVEDATAGDTVVVCGGTYAESVTVNKSLTLVADDGSNVTLAGNTLPDGATAITVDSSADGTVVEGFEATGFGTVVDVSNASDAVIRDLVANDSDTGVAVSASGTATVSNVTVRNVTLDNVITGVLVSSAGTATVSDVNVFRNLVNGSDTGVSIDGDSSVPLEDVGVRQNLVANATSAGVNVTGTTDPAGVRVTRNFFQDNAPYAVENENAGGNLTAWLNHWGDDSGPGSVDPGDPVVDPITNETADGAGDNVSANVRFDPWLGQGACTDPQLVNVTDRTVEVFGEEVRLSGLQPTCVWERAALPLRADDDDAATSVRNLQLFVRGESTADVPANRPRLSVYQQGESFDLRFESTTAADVSRFAGEDTQLLVVRGAEANTDFEVGLDNATGEGRLSVDAASVSVVDTGQLDGDGELTHTFTPASAGDYTFVLVTNDFGSGVRVGDAGGIRVDGGVSVVGVESVPVQNEEASASAVDPSYPAGSNVTFLLDSNLRDASTNHSVLLYNESTFADQRVTIEVDGNVSEALSGDLSSSEVTVERSIRSVNGFIRADVGFSALGFEVDAQDRSGRVDVGPFLDVALSEFGVDGASDTVTSNAVVLNGSVAVVRSGDSDTAVDVETFANFSTGTYRYVYVAQQGSEVSSDTGEVDLTTPTPTPTPTPPPSTPTPTAAPGDGGGGGGGQPGAGPDGEVEIEGTELLNETVEGGQPVVVRVDLANFDPAQGRITLTMTADGEVVTERTVSVGASSRRTVFVRNVFDTAGTFTIGLNGETLGDVTVTAAPGTPGETPPPTTSPPATPTPTDTVAVTDTPEATPTGTAGPTPTLPEGPDAPTGTEIVVTFALVLALLAAVGVVVYVLPAGAV